MDAVSAAKGVMCAPFIGPISMEKHLAAGQIEQVICGGENYDGARPSHFEWVKNLRAECVAHNITFCFIETGTHFIKDGKHYHIPKKPVQSQMGYKSGMNYQGKPIEFDLAEHCCIEYRNLCQILPALYKENTIPGENAL